MLSSREWKQIKDETVRTAESVFLIQVCTQKEVIDKDNPQNDTSLVDNPQTLGSISLREFKDILVSLNLVMDDIHKLTIYGLGAVKDGDIAIGKELMVFDGRFVSIHLNDGDEPVVSFLGDDDRISFAQIFVTHREIRLISLGSGMNINSNHDNKTLQNYVNLQNVNLIVSGDACNVKVRIPANQKYARDRISKGAVKLVEINCGEHQKVFDLKDKVVTVSIASDNPTFLHKGCSGGKSYLHTHGLSQDIGGHVLSGATPQNKTVGWLVANTIVNVGIMDGKAKILNIQNLETPQQSREIEHSRQQTVSSALKNDKYREIMLRAIEKKLEKSCRQD